VLDDAEVMIVDAEATLRTLSVADPTSLSLHEDLVTALRAHGVVLTGHGHELKAASMARFDEAERLLTGRRRDPSDSGAANELAMLLLDKSTALANLDDLPEAVAAIRRAEQVLVQAIAAHPTRLLFVSSLYHVRTFMSELYSLSGDRAAAAGATANARAALARFRPYDADAKKLDALQREGIAQRLHAATLLATNPEAALRELNASEASLRAAVRRRPTYAEDYFQLVETYVGMNTAFAKLGRGKEQLYALAAATTAAQLARWLAPAGQEDRADERLLTTRDLLSVALVRQARFDPTRSDQARSVLEDIMSLGHEFLADPRPDGRALGIIGDAKCRIAAIQRDQREAGWRDTLDAGLIYLRKASALDPTQQEKLQYWTAYAVKSAASR
jgi:hypothetical protein